MKNFGTRITEWCPPLSVQSDFLYCDETRTKKISARMICDGVVHCPFTEIDESQYICSPWHLKLIALSIVVATYLVAMGIAIYLVCVNQVEGEGVVHQVPTQTEKTRLQGAFDLTRAYLKQQTKKNKELMTKHLKNLNVKSKIVLIKACNVIEVKGQEGAKESLFEPQHPH